MKIGFFDSGIGGLSVLHEALKILPNEQYVYFSDGKNIPYGTKTREQVRDLLFAAFDFLAEHGLKAAVVACNTATSVAIEDLRLRHDFPIIGMEPAVKPAVEAAKKTSPNHQTAKSPADRVLVFATELTLRLEKFHNLVARVDTDRRVDYLPLQELVVRAERFEFDDAVILPYLQEKLGGVDWSQYGAVVLGCTHFPFFGRQFRQIVPPHVQIVDGNRGTVNNLVQKLGSNLSVGPGSVAYFLSGERREAAEFERYFGLLDGEKLHSFTQ